MQGGDTRMRAVPAGVAPRRAQLSTLVRGHGDGALGWWLQEPASLLFPRTDPASGSLGQGRLQRVLRCQPRQRSRALRGPAAAPGPAGAPAARGAAAAPAARPAGARAAGAASPAAPPPARRLTPPPAAGAQARGVRAGARPGARCSRAPLRRGGGRSTDASRDASRAPRRPPTLAGGSAVGRTRGTAECWQGWEAARRTALVQQVATASCRPRTFVGAPHRQLARGRPRVAAAPQRRPQQQRERSPRRRRPCPGAGAHQQGGHADDGEACEHAPGAGEVSCTGRPAGRRAVDLQRRALRRCRHAQLHALAGQTSAGAPVWPCLPLGSRIAYVFNELTPAPPCHAGLAPPGLGTPASCSTGLGPHNAK